MKAIYEEHQLIYGAILSRDSEGAVRYMKEHLDNSKNRYQYR
jgi:DNA-binding FadR family transcriptional regulator